MRSKLYWSQPLKEDNRSIKDRGHAHNLLLIQRFHCIHMNGERIGHWKNVHTLRVSEVFPVNIIDSSNKLEQLLYMYIHKLGGAFESINW